MKFWEKQGRRISKLEYEAALKLLNYLFFPRQVEEVGLVLEENISENISENF